MKNEENVKQNKRKLNAVDMIIIVIAACGILAAGIFAFVMLRGDSKDSEGENKSNDAGVTSEYVIKVEKINVDLYSITKGADKVAGCPFLQVGDSVYERESGKYIGKVVSITYEDHVESTNRFETGKVVYATYTGYVDLYITVEAESDNDKGALTVNGYTVRAGSELEFRTYGFYGDGNIVHVDKKTSDAEGGN